ncbi:MAG: methyltransferase domain-containing protein [Pseudomonadota bacterium]|nr:methyltransferase domain-containing protein [Pseudomonadota bacterium]
MKHTVKQYYGETLQGSEDLQTDACCDLTSMPSWLKPLLANIHDEVLARYYGCGLVAPEALEGCRVLDLGSGSGRDVYALAQLVGPKGEVVGVDMTDEQLAVAKAHQLWHEARFGFANTRFIKGDIEALDALGLEAGSFDVVVSNCVINLCQDKAKVLRDVKRLLKPGGEFYFSDVYADRRVPEAVKKDPTLYGECLGGALYWNDFMTLSREAGFKDVRLVEDRRLTINQPELQEKVAPIRFYSATYRLFNLVQLEPACEDYGQAVIYKGGLETSPSVFELDSHHSIEQGKVFPVCGNTWYMLKDTRFAPYFDFIGDFSRHYGLFEGCGTAIPFESSNTAGISDQPCC